MIRVAGPLAPVLLESWWHGLTGPVRAALGAATAANWCGRVAGPPAGASRRRRRRRFQVRDRPSFRVTPFARLRPVGSPADRLVTLRSAGASPVTALLVPLAGWPGSVRARTMLVASAFSTLGGSRPLVRSAMVHSCASRQCRPSVFSAAHRPSFAPKVRTLRRQGPGTCTRCILHGDIRVGSGRLSLRIYR